MSIKNVESTKINIKDRTFSLVRHISDADVSFSLKVSYADPKKSNGFINDSFYLRNKEEAWVVSELLMNFFQVSEYSR